MVGNRVAWSPVIFRDFKLVLYTLHTFVMVEVSDRQLFFTRSNPAQNVCSCPLYQHVPLELYGNFHPVNQSNSQSLTLEKTSRMFLSCWLLLLLLSLKGAFSFLYYFSMPAALHPSFSNP